MNQMTMHTALAGLLALGSFGAATNTWAAPPPMVKCYGIAKAHMNDCASKAHSCAGQSMTDRDPNSFLLVPAGMCQKIADGQTQPK